MVVEARALEPPHLPTLNKWQMRKCANCGVTQSTGMFGTKAVYCHYLELLFCKRCLGTQKRALPWRIIHLKDFKKYPVSTLAAEFLDAIWNVPLIDLPRVAPASILKQSVIERFFAARRGLFAEFVRVPWSFVSVN